MRNIKKIGLSALAGALAMTSAHAGALSVTGGMEISYTKGSNETTSNPLGQATDITLAASTELDNGVTVAYKNTSSDTTLTGDSELVFGNILGGTLAMTSTGSPVSAIDNKTPTAFKDAEMTGSITDVNGGDGTFGIRYTLADVVGSGIKLDYMYFPVHGTGDGVGDEGFSGGGHGNKDAHELTLTGAVPGIDGLNFGVGYYNAKYDLATNARNDRHEGTAYVTYAVGPLTLGAQKGAIGAQGTAGTGMVNTYYGVSYAISDDLSVSYNAAESRKVGNAGGSNNATEQDWDTINLSYSMGGMTINVADSDCSNCTYTAGKSQNERTVSMTIAF
jgi:outer membrane protein OmpU